MKDVLEHLKMERLARGWTLQDVSDRTRINITVLRALESGKTEELGAPLTVEALLRKYSTALGVQTEQLEGRPQEASAGAAETDKARLITAVLAVSAVLAVVCLGVVFRQTPNTGNSNVKSHAPAVSHSATVPEQKTRGMALRHREPAKTEKKAPASTHPNVAAGQAAASKRAAVPSGGSQAAVSVPNRPAAAAPKQPAAVASNRPAALVPNQSAPAVPNQPAEVVPKQPAAVASNRPPATVEPLHSLEMAADQRTWIQVVIDGKKTETELLQPGQIQQWQARNKIDLVVGNGGGVHILWDGKPVRISRTPGRVVRLTLPEQ